MVCVLEVAEFRQELVFVENLVVVEEEKSFAIFCAVLDACCSCCCEYVGAQVDACVEIISYFETNRDAV
jgi:hypothetical protein